MGTVHVLPAHSSWAQLSYFPFPTFHVSTKHTAYMLHGEKLDCFLCCSIPTHLLCTSLTTPAHSHQVQAAETGLFWRCTDALLWYNICSLLALACPHIVHTCTIQGQHCWDHPLALVLGHYLQQEEHH